MAKKLLVLGYGSLLTLALSAAGCDDNNQTIMPHYGKLSVEPSPIVMRYEQAPKSVKLTYLDDNNEPLAGGKAKIELFSAPQSIVMGMEDGPLEVQLDENGQATINISNVLDYWGRGPFTFEDSITLKVYLERPGERWENTVIFRVDYLAGDLTIVSDQSSFSESETPDPETYDLTRGNSFAISRNIFADTKMEDILILSLYDVTNNKDVGDFLKGRTIDFEIDDSRCYLTTTDNVKKQKGQIVLNQHSTAVVHTGITKHEDFTCTYHFSYTQDTVSGKKSEANYKIISHSTPQN